MEDNLLRPPSQKYSNKYGSFCLAYIYRNYFMFKNKLTLLMTATVI